VGSFLWFGPSRPRPIIGPFEFWLLVSPSPLSAHFEVWLIVSSSPLSAHYGVWPIVGPFEFAFTSYLPPSLAASASIFSGSLYHLWTIPTSATAVIIISDFKLKVAEYSTLSLRGMLEYIIL
jgi:hypothetical protein